MPSDAHRSPFRYPGGKAALAPFLAQIIRDNFGVVSRYCEPFAGGAGAATLLLGGNLVESIHLNDADPRIYSAWHSILYDTEKFIYMLQNAPLTMNEWWRQKDILDNYLSHSTIDVGFATFFLNRTNRSGIIQGAGPIGGYAQEGRWGIDARFNRSGLVRRIEFLASRRDAITLTNLDAIMLLESIRDEPIDCFLFIDPPYVGAGSRLYHNSMDADKHERLRTMLGTLSQEWILTYDNHEVVRSLYSPQLIDQLPIRYALQRKRIEREILIKSPGIRLPEMVAGGQY